MTRVPYPEFTRKSPEVVAILEAVPINATRMMANASEGTFKAYMELGKSLYRTTLPPDLREIAVLRAGFIAKSDYETWQHISVARSVGLSEATIEAIRAGQAPDGVMTPAQRAVLAFSSDFILNGNPGDAVLAEVRKHLNDEQLFDLMIATGFYMTVSRILNTAGVQRDQDRGPVDAAFTARAAQ